MSRSSLIWFCLLATLFDFQLSAESHAADKFWNNTSGGNFSTSSNWQSCGFFCNPVAGPNDVAHFGISSPPSPFQFVYTVSFSASVTTNSLLVEDDLVTFDLNGHTYTNSHSPFMVATQIGNVAGRFGQLSVTDGLLDINSVVFVGIAGGTGDLTISQGGRVQSDFFARIGASGSNGAVVVDGSTSQWVHAGELSVGWGGSGTMSVTGGALVQNNSGIIADGSSPGTVNVSGTNSRWINSDLFVGNGGTATLNITAGGRVQSTAGHVAFVAGHTGAVTIDAGRWINSGDLFLGDLGAGTMNITGGGEVQNSGAAIGAAAGSAGGVTVSSSGIIASNWLNSGELNIGHSGSGTLDILTGGAVFNTNGFIGRFAGSTGVVNVNGPDASWNNTGNLAVGNNGDGELNVTSRGIVQSVDGTIGAGAGSTGSVTLLGPFAFWFNSGILRVGDNGHGMLNIEAGGNVSSAGGRIGEGNGSNGTVLVDGPTSAWNSSSNVQVGNSGQASLTVTNGGTVSDTSAEIGGVDGITSSVTIDGVGSRWTNSGGLDVGDSGDAILSVSNGGAVTSSTFGVLADASASDGLATITGAGSTWTINNGPLYVGEDGSGTLNILAGGGVSNLDGFVGFDLGSNGRILVSGTGSTWTNLGILTVGAKGQGSLTIADAGRVSSGSGIIGEQAGFFGSATVSGAGSTWTNNGSLSVGYFGTGALRIAGHGTVSNDFGFIGTFENSSGAATVTGAGSTWNNSRFFAVGQGGHGMLTIEAGGIVSSPRAFIANGSQATGTVTVSGAGSTWTSSEVFVAGYQGVAQLMIQNGGSVASKDAWIAGAASGTSTVTVAGAGSNWTIAGRLAISDAFDPDELPGGGTGTLRIQPGGSVTVAQDTALFPGATLILEGGTFDTASVSINGGGAFNFLSGTLHVGTFNGSLVNQGGTLAPGHSPGGTTIVGSYAQQAGAKLAVEIGGTLPGTTYDVVNITSIANMSGQLQLALLNGFVPSGSDTFTVLSATSGVFGTFTNVANGQRLTTLDSLGSFLVHYGPGSAFNPKQVVLSTFVSADLPGDFNFDGKVDAADYVVWRNELGTTHTQNGFNVWRAHFGQTAGSGSGASASATVPEPATMVLLILTAACFRLSRRRTA